MMRRAAKLLSLSLFFLFIAGRVEAANLHAIIICDTLAENIGNSVESDLNRTRAELHRAAYYTTLNMRETLFIQDKVNEDFLSWIKKYPIDKEDVVFLFFSGHGYRTPSKKDSVWPYLYFTPADKGIDFHHLAKIIQAKGPKLLIAVADCCNNVLPEAYAPTLIKEISQALTYRKPKIKKNYEKLFLHTSGSVIASSSMPGEYSWASKNGGLFTLALFDSLSYEVHLTEPDWDVLFNRALTTVVERDIGQTPQYELSVQRP